MSLHVRRRARTGGPSVRAVGSRAEGPPRGGTRRLGTRGRRTILPRTRPSGATRLRRDATPGRRHHGDGARLRAREVPLDCRLVRARTGRGVRLSVAGGPRRCSRLRSTRAGASLVGRPAAGRHAAGLAADHRRARTGRRLDGSPSRTVGVPLRCCVGHRPGKRECTGLGPLPLAQGPPGLRSRLLVRRRRGARRLRGRRSCRPGRPGALPSTFQLATATPLSWLLTHRGDLDTDRACRCTGPRRRARGTRRVGRCVP